MTFYLRRMMKMYLQRVGNQQKNYNLFFVGILKANEEKSRIRFPSRIRRSVARICGSGSVPKYHVSKNRDRSCVNNSYDGTQDY